MKVINKYFEFVQADLEPVKSFYLKDELNPKVWSEDFELNSEVREQLLQIAQDFYENIEMPTDIVDIAFCGSLCNYNWSEKYSDFDLHVIINFKDIDDNYELVEKACDYAKKVWNAQHDIKIKGYEVEIAIQDGDDLDKAIKGGRMGGVFSLLNNKWIKKPERADFEPDEKLISEKAKTIMMSVDDIEDESKEDEYSEFEEKISKVWKKIKNYRQSGLDSESGEYSVGNLVFKLLRRNGYIGKIMDMKRKLYDKQFESLSENDILKLLYLIEEIDKKYINTEGHSEYINCKYNENEDFIDINYGWSTYEEGSQEDMKVFYKEDPIRVEWIEDSSSVYGDYNNKNEYKFKSIDDLILFIKDQYDDDED
jgi:hypothetical protein